MAEFEVRDLDAVCGAEVLGFDPRVPPDAEARRILRKAFDARELLVFRDVDLDWETQQFLSEMVVGRAETPDDTAVDESVRSIAYVSNKEPGALIPYGRILWHIDTMWSDHPEDAIALYGLEVEADVAPTYYASMTNGWSTLPGELRAQVEGLRALHGEGQQQRAEVEPDLYLYRQEISRSVTTPVALRHPRTGRVMLYVSEQQTRALVGLAPDESDALLGTLLAHLYAPANVYEHRWRENDFVVWDNMAVQHTRPYVALEGPVRTLRKVAAPPPWIRPGLPPRPEMVAVEQ